MTEFEKLFDENKDFIFKYLMKMTHDAYLAEELTQDVPAALRDEVAALLQGRNGSSEVYF